MVWVFERAHLGLKGDVQAGFRDVPTRMQIEGKGLMDRAGGYVSWLAVQVLETRDIGEAEPGFEVTAQIRVLRAPIESMTSGRELKVVLSEVPSLRGSELPQ